jgi:hypothetical protein
MQRQKLFCALMLATLFALALLSAPTNARQQQQYSSEAALKVDSWQEVAPEGEEFSIRMPASPTITTRVVRQGRGKQNLVEREYVVMGPMAGHSGHEVRYFVTSLPMPVPLKNGAITQEEFDKMMYNLQQSFEKSLLTMRQAMVLATPREVFSGAHNGREYAIELTYGMPEGRVRFFSTAKHIYMVGYVNFSYYGFSYLESLQLKNDSPLTIQ